MQKNGYTFATVYSSKCVSIFLNQTLREWGRSVKQAGVNALQLSD